MKEIVMQCTTNTDQTTALYYAVMLNNASVNLASALRRSRHTSAPAARIAPKGQTLYSVRRGN